MVFEVATVLLGVCVGVVAVLYAAPRGYLGHPRKKGSSAAVAQAEMTFAQTEEVTTSPPEAPVVTAEPAPTSAPALYETVQPDVSPAPVSFAPSSVATFGASASRKPTRTYRRRTAPVRSTSATRVPRSARTKKR
jgi:hypothetical protein